MSDEGVARYVIYFSPDYFSFLNSAKYGIRKNPALRRVTSAMFGKEINIPLYKEEAAYGAALSAMAGSGIYGSLDYARQLIRYEGQ